MISRTVLEALGRAPLRFPLTAWPWRSLAYLLSGGGLAAAVYLTVAAVLAAPFGRTAGVLCSVLAIAFGAALAGPLERWRLGLVEPEAPLPPRDRRTYGYGAVSVLAVAWADLAVALVSVGIPGVLLLSPLQPTATSWEKVAGPIAGAMLLIVATYPIGAWAGVRGAVTRSVLAPEESELREVVRSRARLVDAFETERRRIERDLHDGAQQRLVALNVRLGLAALDVPAGSVAAKEISEAHALAKEALAELRELIRNVHPQVLSERGLHAAVRDIAGRSPIPVDVDIELPGRLPAAAETTAFFVTSEALANVAKHSGAAHCRVRVRVKKGVLDVEVMDDGVGGADTEAGSGLTGLADRVAAADGRMFLSSPMGGPTRVRAEIPCRPSVLSAS
ncbi:sensor histidine kinase [Streptomyces smyrnaeus]|uniref:histidine kinase n=1 Tax=Streptomyces smyrnaeus TaxID=1387713 RepID=A0ABS3XSQ3_9ACTN|nr:sensor histidine kinase [Streptomyces smyrnaeus]MBO8198007.1 sensor histidine kinase [Streptomyces smyrnaeus]